MIIQNGTIEFLKKHVCEFDVETGFPSIAEKKEYDYPIPCQYIILSQNLLAKVNNESAANITYEILIEQPIKPLFSEQIRLTDISGIILGEYSIRSVETLNSVCQLRIVV